MPNYTTHLPPMVLRLRPDVCIIGEDQRLDERLPQPPCPQDVQLGQTLLWVVYPCAVNRRGEILWFILINTIQIYKCA